MSKHAQRIVPGILILGLAAITCNLPSTVAGPELSPDDIANTAAARAMTAQAAIAPAAATVVPLVLPSNTAPPAPTACSATVRATTNANVRSGPGTAYDVVGYLPSDGTAPVAGRNDANTWWYIQFPGGYGGYAWVAASVVTTACLPQVVQVVAAPPLPTAPPTDTPKVLALQPLLIGPLQVIQLAPGDIEVQDVFLSTGGEVVARVAVSPTSALSGNVTYKVWVDGSLQATNSQALPAGSMAFWSGVTISGTHTVRVKVDTNNAYNETDEGNNEWQGELSH